MNDTVSNMPNNVFNNDYIGTEKNEGRTEFNKSIVYDCFNDCNRINNDIELKRDEEREE